MKVDFHVHSTASDGTFSPAWLAGQGESGGFAAMAITDHDNCDGVEEFLSAPCGGRRFGGIELSVEPGEGFDKFHLLGIGIDGRDAGLRDFLGRILEGRNERNAAIIGNFRRLGIEMEAQDDIKGHAHGDVLARPHFARWLTAHGYAGSVAEAFERYLLPDSPPETRCYEERYHPPQEEAFAVLHAAGAVTVMAHPRYWRDEWKRTGCDFAAARKALAPLKEKGLDAVETFYQANTAEETVEFTRIALSLGFLVSAGSDFHGENKPTVPLGMEVSDSLVSPFLERLGGV